MTTLVAIVQGTFRSTGTTYLPNRLRGALARDTDLPIDIPLDRRHAVALLDLDR
jgi:hypothetical protein